MIEVSTIINSHQTLSRSVELTTSLLETAPAEEIQSVFDNIVGLGEVFQAIGLVLLMYGALGWLGYSSQSKNSNKGKQLFGFGILFFAIGFNYDGFLQVIKYVLGV